MKNNFLIIVADASKCALYCYSYKNNQLEIIDEIYQPLSRLRDKDLVTDRVGHYKTFTSARGAYESPGDPKKNLIERFVKEEICGKINKLNNYTKIVLIAPPHVMGLINNNLNSEADKKIIHKLNKDYSHLTKHELRQYLHENWHDVIRKP